MKEENKCPHCSKKHPWPDVVDRNAEAYGGSFSTCKCRHCGKLIDVYSRVDVFVGVRGKSDKEESDWFE